MSTLSEKFTNEIFHLFRKQISLLYKNVRLSKEKKATTRLSGNFWRYKLDLNSNLDHRLDRQWAMEFLCNLQFPPFSTSLQLFFVTTIQLVMTGCLLKFPGELAPWIVPLNSSSVSVHRTNVNTVVMSREQLTLKDQPFVLISKLLYQFLTHVVSVQLESSDGISPRS